MGVLSHMPLVVLLALMSVFFLAAFTQAVHALFIATRREVSPARVIFAYEMLIVVHLVLACCTANSASRGFVVLLAQFRPYAFPLDVLLWVNLAIAAFGLALAIAKRRPVLFGRQLRVPLHSRRRVFPLPNECRPRARYSPCIRFNHAAFAHRRAR